MRSSWRAAPRTGVCSPARHEDVIFLLLAERECRGGLYSGQIEFARIEVQEPPIEMHGSGASIIGVDIVDFRGFVEIREGLVAQARELLAGLGLRNFGFGTRPSGRVSLARCDIRVNRSPEF